jgi:hypothetical protein
MLMAIQVCAVKQKSGGYHILLPDDVVMVRGGASSSNGGGTIFSPSPAAPDPVRTVNITLSNVPYVHQYIYNGANRLYRSRDYCGIASALMVRGKNEKGTSAPILYYSGLKTNAQGTNDDLKKIDENLQQGQYGNYGKQVDVYANHGLLYLGRESIDEQYSYTTDILKGVFTGKLRSVNDTAFNYGYVKSVTMGVMSATIGTSNSATKAIWDHINTYNEPVVVVVDSNKQNNINTQNYTAPTLHYIVIMGIREASSGGTRYFSVYDPANNSSYPIQYTEANLRYFMEMPSNAPEWVYWYGMRQANPPAYILKVKGK